MELQEWDSDTKMYSFLPEMPPMDIVEFIVAINRDTL